MDSETKSRLIKVVEESAHFFERPRETTQVAAEVEIASPGPHKSRNHSGWQARFTTLIGQNALYHDEPWLTLMALWGLCGKVEFSKEDSHRLDAINQALKSAFKRNETAAPQFARIDSVRMEVQLPENLLYRAELKNFFHGSSGRHHPYVDRHNTLINKLSENRQASLEGNTNLDALISGRQTNGKPGAVFIEAKFLSDISKDITYAVARNQIARNIDCAMDVVTNGGKDLDELQNFWFILLTPGMFRTDTYGGKSIAERGYAELLQTDRSRLYCYKMDEYQEPQALLADLPHWEKLLTTDNAKRGQELCNRIGWMTFEDIAETVLGKGLLSEDDSHLFREFFTERGVLQASSRA